MTVLENLLVGAVPGGGLSEKRGREISYDILNLIQLHHAKDHMAGGLPLLDRKRLELGRALATQPSLILLDEIAGVDGEEAEQVLGSSHLAEGDYHRWIEHILT
jgi:branched-chain amino acid transport system ATP-binding protein